jgi:hypothetical protein
MTQFEMMTSTKLSGSEVFSMLPFRNSGDAAPTRRKSFFDENPAPDAKPVAHLLERESQQAMLRRYIFSVPAKAN